MQNISNIGNFPHYKDSNICFQEEGCGKQVSEGRLFLVPITTNRNISVTVK